MFVDDKGPSKPATDGLLFNLLPDRGDDAMTEDSFVVFFLLHALLFLGHSSHRD